MESPTLDYVFKDTAEGIKFVGDFDGLYLNVADPWGQIANNIYRGRRLLLLNTLLELNPVSVLDVGSGLGHTTQLIKILVTHNVLGIDISSIAVDRASKLFPDVDFRVMDIRKEFPEEAYDVIVLNNILWYILYDLEKIITEAEKHLTFGGHLVIPQAFIPNQKYGCDVINGYDGLARFVNDPDILYKYTLVKTLQVNHGQRKTDSITVLKKR